MFTAKYGALYSEDEYITLHLKMVYEYDVF